MAAVDKTNVYRDATYSAATQDALRELLRSLELPGVLETVIPEQLAALRDVVERWDANDATEVAFVDEPTVAVSPLLSPDPTFADASITVYKAACPECRCKLDWAIEMPPIPRTLYSWFDPNGEGQRIIDCPECGVDLPEGDLTKLAPAPRVVDEELPPVQVMRAGPVYASVCAAADVERDEIERVTNGTAPTGISSRWQISTDETSTFADGAPNPCPCPDHPDRLHYLLNC